ncbi:glycoside hydrolase domain-containing protein [Amycolatopsis magusensis]|uniref:Peptidoglycan hydrolase-like protein with peptidoglycan-binding domain n=1 Tax=Amycolatopsis magusensis TaxID=882444 RepID=A0ABS4PTJ3_9PSEU|nr:glycoside hydrolase domain-containing protein [Amycolatopsis magusensis]MBP2182748.1 peptidoglycan hydrolase-like protein with peptidoglycan-binding domain [Amycolatopsis magusensis]
MDERVLDAQKWVNATYGSVAGYQPCPENGRTGWSTMYALTMGLQHELGISPVVASFGPGTMAKVKELGDIGFGWNRNSNIVRIIQHGLFCKGYHGANGYGEYGAVTTEAVKNMRVNMGLPDGGTGTAGGQVTPQLFRCVLNMDAYVVIGTGSEKVRGIQQWLNGRYWQRDAYTIGPCDGHYSRDVQKSLMIGLQYELGISQPNGNFGPSTQAGLKTRTVGPGSSGIFVELFSAACVFNEPVPIGDVRTTQKSTYDDALGTYVTKFQEFSQLTVNGRGTYETWAQLLVSMGDADRPAHGCDTRFEITASRAQWLKTNGYKVVGRYLYDPPGSTLDKEIKPGELQTIFGAGMRVYPIYQDNARQLADFTYSQGYQHALNAHQLAAGYGFNRGTVIYFAVDYDATQEQIDSAIVPYFHGVQAGLAYRGKKYVHGVYGSRNVCANITNRTYARHSFVSGMSWGFSGNLGFPLPANWSFNQIKEFTVTNGADVFDLDRDVARNQGGDPGQGSVSDPTGPADAFIGYVQRLYDCAGSYGKGDRSRLVMEYIRHRAYNDWKWKGLIGGVDEDFVNYANAQGLTVMTEFVDPVTGYTLGTEHMMATANGHLVYPQPDNSKRVNAGDIAGWGGDLLTFYADWRDAVDTYPNGHTFCDEKLAKPDVTTSFGFADLIEDADGYLIARRVAAGTDIVTAVRDQYNGGGALRRFTHYYQQRFTNAEDCNFLAHNILTAADDPKVVLAQLGLIGIHAPPRTLGFEDLQRFEQGFADTLLARTGMESRMAKQYKANHDTYLREAQQRAAR